MNDRIVIRKHTIATLDIYIVDNVGPRHVANDLWNVILIQNIHKILERKEKISFVAVCISKTHHNSSHRKWLT